MKWHDDVMTCHDMTSWGYNISCHDDVITCHDIIMASLRHDMSWNHVMIMSWHHHVMKCHDIIMSWHHLVTSSWHHHVMTCHHNIISLHVMICHDMIMTSPYHDMSWHIIICHDIIMTCHDMMMSWHDNVMAWHVMTCPTCKCHDENCCHVMSCHVMTFCRGHSIPTTKYGTALFHVRTSLSKQFTTLRHCRNSTYIVRGELEIGSVTCGVLAINHFEVCTKFRNNPERIVTCTIRTRNL